jgi:hypothetical protein
MGLTTFAAVSRCASPEADLLRNPKIPNQHRKLVGSQYLCECVLQPDEPSGGYDKSTIATTWSQETRPLALPSGCSEAQKLRYGSG